MTAFVEVKNLNVKYGDKSVLKNVSLTIEEGQTVGIIGRSGAGKTILLHVLRGLDEDIPASGSVIYHTARCESCGFVNPPSGIAKPCPRCGGKMSPWDVDILHTDEDSARAISRRWRSIRPARRRTQPGEAVPFQARPGAPGFRVGRKLAMASTW